MSQIDLWPKQYLKANFKMIEQDLYTFRLMKETVVLILKVNELETTRQFHTGLINVPLNEMDNEMSQLKEYRVRNLTNQISSNCQGSQATEPDIKNLQWEDERKYLRNILAGTQFSEMLRRVEAIEFVLTRLDNSEIGSEQKKSQLIRERYFENKLNPDGLALKFNISRRTVFYWCNDVIQEIANRLGFIV